MYVSPWERYSNQTATGVCRLPELAAELVRLPVDVIVTTFTPCALAAKQVTTTIPIVIMMNQTIPLSRSITPAPIPRYLAPYTPKHSRRLPIRRPL